MHAILLSLALTVAQGAPAAAQTPSAALAPMVAAQTQIYAVDLPARIRDLARLRVELARIDARRLPLALAEAPLGTPELAPPIPGDPGDSLYRAGTAALNRGDYARAAQLFHQVREKYARSVRAGDSYYWEAFALYRQSGSEHLRTARTLLAQQKMRFPSAATGGDASSLYARVQGELARRGDPDAQIWVNTQTRALAPAVVATPVPDRPEAPERPEAVERPEAPERPEVTPRADVARVVGRGRSEGGDDDALPAGCDRTSYDTKIEALNALISMNDERAVPILRHVLAKRDNCSAGLRRKAVFLLAQHQDDSTGAVLLDVVKNDPDPDVQSQAVFWLSQVKSPEAVTALESILKTSADVELQRRALFSLSQQEDPRGADILRAYAERSDVTPELQEQAIFWLSQSNDPKNGAFLRGLYGRLTRESAKERVLFDLSQQGDTANGAWLIGRAKDVNESMELRKKALFWAGQREVPISDLVGLYATMPDQQIREQLIFVYSQSKDRAAADKLFDIARNDPDPELRKKALFWLGQSNDPRVMQLLQDIIDK